MGGSSKQTVGYKYFAGLQVALGSCIERILNINPDNRGWILSDRIYQDILKEGDVSLGIAMPNIFGGDKQEGGWVGMIDIHTGRPEYIRQNGYLAEHDSELVSSFPYLSYVVFKGYTIDKGFQLVSMSGMLKDVLYWPKRTRIKDDGSVQWYESYIAENGDQIIVCEIDTIYSDSAGVSKFNAGTTEIRQSRRWDLNSPFTVLAQNNTALSSWSFILNTSGDWHTAEKSGTSTLRLRNVRNVIIKVTVTHPSKMVAQGGAILLVKTVEDDGVTKTEEIYAQSNSEDFDVIIYFEYTDGNPVGGVLYTYMRIEAIPYFLVPANSYYYSPDINPIHQIREIITNDTAMNKPESYINDENFKFAARRIWDERLGVSGAFTEKSCKDAIDELLYHIEAGIRVNRQTGLYEIVLFRDDLLDLDNAQLFDKSNIKTFNIEIANIDDVINSVNVNFYDRKNIKDSSFSLDEIGGVLSSELNAQTLDFPYFMNRRNAELVGNWKLKQLSTPTRKGSFTTGKYDARKINRYDVVKLTWLNQNMLEVPVRIMKIGLGDGIDNTVTLDWVEVIPYSSINYPSINVDQSTSVVLPPQPNQSIVFEMPYFEAVQQFGQAQVDAELANNPDLGYLMVATKRLQNNSINALLYTDNGTGYEEASLVNYCPTATLDQNIGYLDSSFAVKNVASISQAEVGTLILCDDELMVYQSYDTATNILSVKRAALDTVPKPHSQDAIFYFYDAFNAFDSEQYVLSEVINAKVLTTTPSGVQGLGDATALSVEMDARAIRPYPSANVKINDEYYPTEIATDLVVTWVDRNRLQQTGGSVLGWTDGGVTIESDTSTMLTIKELDVDGLLIATHNIDATGTNTYTLAISSMQAETRSIEVTAKTVRDGYESYQYFQHIVQISMFFSAPYNITYTVRSV